MNFACWPGVWLCADFHVIHIPGSSNSVNVTLGEDELKKIHTTLRRHRVHGDRCYGANVNMLTWG